MMVVRFCPLPSLAIPFNSARFPWYISLYMRLAGKTVMGLKQQVQHTFSTPVVQVKQRTLWPFMSVSY